MSYEHLGFIDTRDVPLVPRSPGPSCYSSPSAAASSSRIHIILSDLPNTHAAQEASRHLDAIKGTGPLEWDSDTDADSSVSMTDPSRGHAAMNDVCGMNASSSISSRAARARRKYDRAYGNSESRYNQLLESSGNPRSTVVLTRGRIKPASSRSSEDAASSAQSQSAGHNSLSQSHLPPHDHVDAHAYASHINIRDWLMTVETGRQSSPHRTASLLDSLHAVPHDVYLEATTSYSITSQTSAMTSSSHNSLHPDPVIASLNSSSSASDHAVGKGLNDWRLLMGESSSFQVPSTSSARSSTRSSTVGMASTLLLESSLLDESMCQSALGQWSDTEGWSNIGKLEREESTSGSSREFPMEDAYPRSATASSRHTDADFQHVGLPAVLEHEDFSALMLQSFTLALADASLEDRNNQDNIPGHDDTPELSCPNYIPSLDFINQWFPSALRSSSSASSQDPFHLDLFSPASEQPDAASIWDNFTQSPEDSASPGYYSSSPFVGWSSASDTEAKPALLPMGYIAPPPFSAIPLHQPQPIRIIPPIPLHLLDDSDDPYVGS